MSFCICRECIPVIPFRLFAKLDDKEVTIQCDNEDKDEDDDDEDLDSEVFKQGRSGWSDRSTEFELDSRERLWNF